MKKIIAGIAAAGGFWGVFPAYAETVELETLVNQGLNYATKAGLGTEPLSAKSR